MRYGSLDDGVVDAGRVISLGVVESSSEISTDGGQQASSSSMLRRLGVDFAKE